MKLAWDKINSSFHKIKKPLHLKGQILSNGKLWKENLQIMMKIINQIIF
jgi:hypothetical protein